MKKYVVRNEDLKERLDKVIANRFPELSRVSIQRLIQNEKIVVNQGEQKAKASYKVNLNDVILIEEEKTKEIDLKPEDIPLDIVYEDNDIIAVNKQKGLVVHPGNGNPDGTLVNAIMNICKTSLSGIGGKLRPGIVHRLDKDTSGIIIIAKNDKAHIEITNQIVKREVKKKYIALVRGIIKENEATINMPIDRDSKNRKKMTTSKKGKEAITHFKVLKRYEGYTLLEVNIETGRTHQIRVHLSQIGYPIVGDATYSNGKNPFGVNGQMLHAQKLEFRHPITNKKMLLEATLPRYFEEILEDLSKKGRALIGQMSKKEPPFKPII